VRPWESINATETSYIMQMQMQVSGSTDFSYSNLSNPEPFDYSARESLLTRHPASRPVRRWSNGLPVHFTI